MNKFTLLLLSLVAITLASCSKKASYANFNQTSSPSYVNVDATKKLSKDIASLEETVTIPTVSEELKEKHEEFHNKLQKHRENIDKLKNNADLSRKELKSAKNIIQKELKRDIKDELKTAKKAGNNDEFIPMLILSILIAPIGLGLIYGWGSTEFWIGLILFLLFWFPGAIYGGLMAYLHYN